MTAPISPLARAEVLRDYRLQRVHGFDQRSAAERVRNFHANVFAVLAANNGEMNEFALDLWRAADDYRRRIAIRELASAKTVTP